MSMSFQDRLGHAYKRESVRRANAGEPRLTYTIIWKAAGATSGAATHWFSGANAMDLNTCMKVAPALRVNPWWLYDESREIDDPYGGIPLPDDSLRALGKAADRHGRDGHHTLSENSSHLSPLADTRESSDPRESKNDTAIRWPLSDGYRLRFEALPPEGRGLALAKFEAAIQEAEDRYLGQANSA